MFIAAAIVYGGFVFGPCFVMQYIYIVSSLRKGVLVALLKLCSFYSVFVGVLCLFLAAIHLSICFRLSKKVPLSTHNISFG